MISIDEQKIFKSLKPKYDLINFHNYNVWIQHLIIIIHLELLQMKR